MAHVYILNGYRGKTITNEEFWPKGEREVTDEQAAYLVANGHAQYAGRAGLQGFVGVDPSVAVSIDNVFATLEGLTDNQLIELGALNGLVIPRTATREQAIRALVTAAVRPGANLMLSVASKGAVRNDLLPRTEQERQFLPVEGSLPSEQERDRLLSRGARPLSDLEYSALSLAEKEAYEKARGTMDVGGVDVDLSRMSKAKLIEYGAQRNIALDDSMKQAEMIELLTRK